MERPDEERLSPESLLHPTGDVLNWGDADAAAPTRGKLEEFQAMIQGKSPGEVFAMTRAWLEERPMATTLIGFGLGFALGRLLRRS